MFYKTDKIALLIDGQSNWHASKALGKHIDYSLVIKEFAQRGRLVHAYYYVAIDDDNPDNPVRPIVDWLSYNGFVLRTKPLKKRENQDGTTRYKGNMNLEIALDAVDLSETVDHIVLFAGDGDLVPLIHNLQRRGSRITVVSTMRGDMPVVSDEIRRAADNFVEIDKIPVFKEAYQDQRRAS